MMSSGFNGKGGSDFMKILRTRMENFMIFEDMKIDWSPNINVICGENSTGKTTILKCLYALLKPYSR